MYVLDCTLVIAVCVRRFVFGFLFVVFEEYDIIGVVTSNVWLFFFFFQAEDGIRDLYVTGVQTCALPISRQASVRTAYPTTSIPIDLAVPDTLLIAAATDAAFKSGIFCLAMSSTCFSVTLPTLSLFGAPEIGRASCRKRV